MNPIHQKLTGIAAGIFSGQPVLFAYLYGSYATGLSHRYSDLDIAVFVKDTDVIDSLAFELSLSLKVDEALGHRVDTEVRIINHLPLPVVGRILTEGHLVYSISEDIRIAYETRMRGAYFDFLPVIRQYRNACFKKAVEA